MMMMRRRATSANLTAVSATDTAPNVVDAYDMSSVTTSMSEDTVDTASDRLDARVEGR